MRKMMGLRKRKIHEELIVQSTLSYTGTEQYYLKTVYMKYSDNSSGLHVYFKYKQVF